MPSDIYYYLDLQYIHMCLYLHLGLDLLNLLYPRSSVHYNQSLPLELCDIWMKEIGKQVVGVSCHATGRTMLGFWLHLNLCICFVLRCHSCHHGIL